jgi:multicomponent Na+:H+ antiporter subunit B
MQEHTIPRIVSVALIPAILVFGFYVQFHGEISPGGGFQAGVIIASAVILYGLIFDVNAAKQVVPPAFCRILSGSGVLLYGGTGLISIFKGGEFLNYSLLLDHGGQHLGLVLIELGVLLTVASVMVLIFYAFNSRNG